MRYQFVKAEHEEFGSTGWKMKDTNLDPLGGMGTAHDILEHFGEKNISAASEFKALGASLWVRKTYAAQKGSYTTDQGKHIASDFPSIMRHVINGDERLPVPPPTRPLEEEAEIQINKAITEFRRESRDEFEPNDRAFVVGMADRIRGWLRIGYRAAKRRYRHHDHYTITSLFMDIETQSDKLLKTASEFDILNVDLDIKKATAKVWLDYDALLEE